MLRNAALAGAGLECLLVTLERAERVTGSHGLTVEPQGTLDGGPFDLVIVPGGGWQDRAAAGAYAESERGELPAALGRLHEGGARLASVCTGGMLLAAAGLAAGRAMVTHRLALEDLRARGAEVLDARVVDEGDLVSCGGVTAGLDLALWIVERDFGHELADRIAAAMEYERRGPVWERDSTTAA